MLLEYQSNYTGRRFIILIFIFQLIGEATTTKLIDTTLSNANYLFSLSHIAKMERQYAKCKMWHWLVSRRSRDSRLRTIPKFQTCGQASAPTRIKRSRPIPEENRVVITSTVLHDSRESQRTPRESNIGLKDKPNVTSSQLPSPKKMILDRAGAGLGGPGGPSRTLSSATRKSIEL